MTIPANQLPRLTRCPDIKDERLRLDMDLLVGIINSLIDTGVLSQTNAMSWKIGTVPASGLPVPLHGGTPKSVLFVGAGGDVTQDNANLIYDSALFTLSATNIQTPLLIASAVELQDTFGVNAGFIQAQPQADSADVLLWENTTASALGPAHRFDAVGSTNVPTAVVAIAAQSTAKILQGLSGTNEVFAFSSAGALTITNATSSALLVGRQGSTNPVLQVDASTASVVTGLLLKGAASGAGFALSVTSSAAAEPLTINALGSGQITLGSVSTGVINLNRAVACANTLTVTNATAFAFSAGRQGGNNPAFQVDASTATVVTGWKVKGAASGGKAALSVISSATNEDGTVDAKGSGVLRLGTVSTGGVTCSGNFGVFGTVPAAQQTGDAGTALATFGFMTGTPTFQAANLTGAGKGSQAFVAGDVTTTSSGMANVTGLSLAIAASEVWELEFQLVASGAAAGMTFQLTGPSAPTNVRIWTMGNTSAVTAVSSDTQTALASATQAYLSGSITGVVTLRACIENGANAGTLQLQFAAAVNTQSNTVLRGSFLSARRIS